MPSIRREITLDLEAYERSQEIGNLSLFVRRCLMNTGIHAEGREMGQVDINAHFQTVRALQSWVQASRLLTLALIEQVQQQHPDYLEQFEGHPQGALEGAISHLQAQALQQKSILDFEA